jgi:HTH-type transcriptional regulator / antitoxin HigA
LKESVLTTSIPNGIYKNLMFPEIIKNTSTYERYLSEINRLMDYDPSPDSQEGKRLELLVHLVSKFEKEKYPRPETNPIDAILFRMEQAGLRQADLVPFIGSRSKVSEVLAGKRPLTLSMIQALHAGLGIPANILIQPIVPEVTKTEKLDWKRFPIKEMCKRGWINEKYEVAKLDIEKCVSKFFGPLSSLDQLFALNKTSNVRSGREMNRYALAAWSVRVVRNALENPPTKPWVNNNVTLDFMRQVAKLSVLPNGPVLAQELLKDNGISLVIEASLPQTYLDGSAIMMFEQHPIVGMTLRYDRIDNFWFTLMHELAHISLHYGKGVNQFIDDLDVKRQEDPRETEADDRATEALIPKAVWAKSPARVAPSKNTILRFARQIDVHPAIVAGRVRREKNSYHLFNDLIGHGRIKYLFGFTGEGEDE